jgi:hypothetical protein
LIEDLQAKVLGSSWIDLATDRTIDVFPAPVLPVTRRDVTGKDDKWVKEVERTLEQTSVDNTGRRVHEELPGTKVGTML